MGKWKENIKWLCFLLPLIALPFFLFFGFVYGMSFDIAPPNTEETRTRAAMINLIYVLCWLVYLFACVKWRSKMAAWVFIVHWCITATSFVVLRLDIDFPALLRPIFFLALPLNGLFEKPLWGTLVHGIMLVLGIGVVVFLYLGYR